MKYDAAKIMMSDKKGVDESCGENNLYREGMDFDTVAKTDTLIEAMPKAGKSQALDQSILNADKDNALYSDS
jgi:hypothetical protein